ncbi:MAG: major facilitator superfamily 1 [Acidobacteria bacterium]|nr:major facilitator superfamily 1 [Acidobacteriota bacterium]
MFTTFARAGFRTSWHLESLRRLRNSTYPPAPPSPIIHASMPSLANVDRRAWRALFAAQLGWMLDAMDFLLFTYAIVPIRTEFGLSKGTMGLLTSVALIASAIGGIVFGRLADRIGRVRAMTWSILIYSFATAGLATATALWQLAAWRVLVGLGMGGEWSSGSVLVAETWPKEHRAKAMGIMQSGWAIGALFAAALAALMLDRVGWRALFLVGALPAVAAFFIRRNVEEPPIWTNRDRREMTRWDEMFSPQYVKRTVIATLLASSVLIAFWGVITWLPAFLATPASEGGAGMTLTKSALWLIVVQVGAFLGYISFGWIADRFGRRPAFTFFMIAATLLVPLFAFGARSTTSLLILGPLVGYFGHGFFSVFGAMLAELFPTRMRASAQGFCYNAGRLASAAAPFAIGAAAQSHGLGTAIAVDSLFFAVGAVLIWLLPETKGADL